jgi:predicted nucleic acid-binding protein
MSVLLDTSILCRLANAADVDFALASQVITVLHNRGERLCVTAQNFVEFRNVATRPKAVNGIGLSAAQADQLTSTYEASFQFLAEIPAIFTAWKEIVSKGSVIGKQVHDARLVAVCQVHQVEKMLTFNVGHLSRLAALVPRLTILDPLSFLPPATPPTSQST